MSIYRTIPITAFVCVLALAGQTQAQMAMSHDHMAMPSPASPIAPQAAPAPEPQPMNTPMLAMPPMGDTAIYAHGLLDQFEGRIGGTGNAFRWSGEAWIGTDRDKLWLKSKGFALGRGGIADGQNELLYSHAVSPYADLQAGVRTDRDTAPGRTWTAFGVQGLAPMFFNYEATAYLSDRGHAATKLAASYDLLLTQRLVLQPQIEMSFYSKADPARGVGAGLSDIDTGLRLRYEVTRKFAPYIGVTYAGKFGQTASMAKQSGDGTSAVRFVFGIRSWF
jgi:copper resistance protein B